MALPLYVFDAYGTLFDVHSAVARHRDLIGPEADRLSQIWRAQQLEYTWVYSLMRQYRDFRRLTEDALDFAAAACGGPVSYTHLDVYKRQMYKHLLSVGGFTLLSRITGFLRDVMLGAILGAGLAADAFVIAFRLPNHFRAICLLYTSRCV